MQVPYANIVMYLKADITWDTYVQQFESIGQLATRLLALKGVTNVACECSMERAAYTVSGADFKTLIHRTSDQTVGLQPLLGQTAVHTQTHTV